MELFILIGLAAVYSWIHGAVICFKKLHGLTKYEKVVCWTAFVTLVLIWLGAMK